MKRLARLTRNLCCFAGCCLATAFATPAARAADSSATTSAALGVVAVAGAILVIAAAAVVVVVLWLARRRHLTELEGGARALRRELDRLCDVIRAVPMAPATWKPGMSAFVPSDELVAMLGAPEGAESLDDLTAAFRLDDAAALKEACRRFVGSAAEFSLEVATAGEKRTFDVTASSVGTEDGVRVVWFRETTIERAALASMTERCRVLEAEREHFSQTLNTLPMPVWRRNTDLALSWVNYAHRDAVEAGADVDPAYQNMELVPGVEAGEARALARRAVERKEAQAEIRRFVVGGERRSFELVELPLDSGEVVGFAHDITERDDAMGELARYSEANTEVFNRLQSAIAIFSADKRLTFFNDAFARMWGFEEGRLERQPGHDEILEGLRQRRRLPEQVDFLAYKNSVLEHYTSLMEPHEEMEVLPDGTTLRIVMSPHPLGGLMIVYEDVTDRLELERAQNTSQAVQRAILDHLLEGVAVFGSDGRLKLCNAGYRNIWRLSEEFVDPEPHVSDVVEACRDLIFGGSDQQSDWRSLKERIVDNALEREPQSGRLRLTDGRTIRCSGVPLPDGTMLYTYAYLGLVPLGEHDQAPGGSDDETSRTSARGP